MTEGTVIEPSDDLYIVLVQYSGAGPWWSASEVTRVKTQAEMRYREAIQAGNRAEIVHCLVKEKR